MRPKVETHDSDTVRPQGMSGWVVLGGDGWRSSAGVRSSLGFVARALERRRKPIPAAAAGERELFPSPVGRSRVLGERSGLGTESEGGRERKERERRGRTRTVTHSRGLDGTHLRRALC